MTEPHDCRGGEDCRFPEVDILEDDGDLKAGMKVLVPCPSCGGAPLEEMEWTSNALEQTQKAFELLLADRNTPLYHWAPAARRGQITRYGLRPKMRPTTNADPSYVAPYVCLADDPAWAWALSGHQKGSPAGEWDLWMTWAERLKDPHTVPRDDANGVHEIRTDHRIYKRDLFYVASRSKR